MGGAGGAGIFQPLLIAIWLPLLAGAQISLLGRVLPRSVVPIAAGALLFELLSGAALLALTAGGRVVAGPETLLLTPERPVRLALQADAIAALGLFTLGALGLAALALWLEAGAGRPAERTWPVGLLVATGAVAGLLFSATPTALATASLLAALGIFAFVATLGDGSDGGGARLLGAYWAPAAALALVAAGLALSRGGAVPGVGLLQPDTSDRSALLWALLGGAAMAFAGLFPAHRWRAALFRDRGPASTLALTALLAVVALVWLARPATQLFGGYSSAGFSALPPRYGQWADLWLLGAAITYAWALTGLLRATALPGAAAWAALSVTALGAFGLASGSAAAALGGLSLWTAGQPAIALLLLASPLVSSPAVWRLQACGGRALAARHVGAGLALLAALSLAGVAPLAGASGALLLGVGLAADGRAPLVALEVVGALVVGFGVLRQIRPVPAADAAADAPAGGGTRRPGLVAAAFGLALLLLALSLGQGAVLQAWLGPAVGVTVGAGDSLDVFPAVGPTITVPATWRLAWPLLALGLAAVAFSLWRDRRAPALAVAAPTTADPATVVRLAAPVARDAAVEAVEPVAAVVTAGGAAHLDPRDSVPPGPTGEAAATAAAGAPELVPSSPEGEAGRPRSPRVAPSPAPAPVLLALEPERDALGAAADRTAPLPRVTSGADAGGLPELLAPFRGRIGIGRPIGLPDPLWIAGCLVVGLARLVAGIFDAVLGRLVR